MHMNPVEQIVGRSVRSRSTPDILSSQSKLHFHRKIFLTSITIFIPLPHSTSFPFSFLLSLFLSLLPCCLSTTVDPDRPTSKTSFSTGRWNNSNHAYDLQVPFVVATTINGTWQQTYQEHVCCCQQERFSFSLSLSLSHSHSISRRRKSTRRKVEPLPPEICQEFQRTATWRGRCELWHFQIYCCQKVGWESKDDSQVGLFA